MSESTWKKFDPNSFERDTQCVANGEDHGLREIPATDETTLSDAELDIVNAVQSKVEQEVKIKEDLLEDKEKLINKLELDITRNRFADMKSDLSTKLGIVFNNFENNVQHAYREWLSSRKAYNAFKTDNRITRPYNHKNFTRKAISLFAVIAICTFEILANREFLTSAMSGGANAALVLSCSIAFINVFVSFLIGMTIARQLNHFKISRRAIFGVLLALYVLFTIWLNFSVGTFRTLSQGALLEKMAGTILGPTDLQELGSIAMQPWNHLSVLDPTGWTLIIMGITFAAIGIGDGYQFDDVYPGYGKVGNKMTSDKQAYLTIEKKAVNEANNEYDSALKAAKTYEADDDNMRGEWSDLINECQKIYMGFSKWIILVETNILQHCIDHYRKKNKQLRKTPAPAYFNDKVKFDTGTLDVKSQFADSYDNCFYSDKDRKDKVIEWNNLNKEQYNSCLSNLQSVKKEFDENVRKKKDEFSIYT